MPKSRRAMRHLIVSHLMEHLRVYYDLDLRRQSPASDHISDVEIDVFLAFKSDSTLDELRSSLIRLENGTYGRCVGCKQQINQALLDDDPIRRVCSRCEKEFTLCPLESYAHGAHTSHH